MDNYLLISENSVDGITLSKEVLKRALTESVFVTFKNQPHFSGMVYQIKDSWYIVRTYDHAILVGEKNSYNYIGDLIDAGNSEGYNFYIPDTATRYL